MAKQTDTSKDRPLGDPFAKDRFEQEPIDMDAAVAIGERWGFGNVIQRLQYAWSDAMVRDQGLTRHIADHAAGLIDDD